MLTYWLIYFIPAGLALFASKRFSQTNLVSWYIIGFLFILIIGFRYEVGGDWSNYLRHYNRVTGISFSQAIGLSSLGHISLNWLMASWGAGVYGVNMIYGAIFIAGLVRFSRDQINPWIAFAVAVPYLVIVVAMGYSRQGVAIGFFLLAISYLRKGKLKVYIALIFFAALFHKTAVLLLPLGIFLYRKGLAIRILMLIPIAYGAWDLMLADKQEYLWRNYVEVQRMSEGAKIRVLMNLVPSMLLLMYRKEWKKKFPDYSFWFWIALGSIISMGLVDFASTAVDRIALYFIPIQLIVFARLPYLARKQISPKFTKIMVILGYCAVMIVWLNFANHAEAWIPYQNVFFKDVF